MSDLDNSWVKELAVRYEASTFIINRRMNAMMRELLDKYSITVDQFAIMRFLNQQQKSTSSELADGFRVGKSSITAIVNRLFEKELVERQPDKEDRRVVYLKLTEQGEKLCSKMEGRAYELLTNFIHPMEKEEAISFVETLEMLADRMQKQDRMK